MDEISRLFPERLQKELNRTLAHRWDTLQEIRLRLQQPVELIFNQTYEQLAHFVPDKHDFTHIIQQLSDYSLYRMEEELREGYMTIEGGHRVGLAGKVNTLHGSVKAIQYITFLNIRIAKQKVGTANKVISHLYQQGYVNTLIIGAPQTGKTTLVRDIARMISTGWEHVPPNKVGIIDERSEIAASIKGIPQHDVGARTDVMDACPKAEGMMMMIRSMSPEVLIVDEIGNQKDVNALMEALHAGVAVVCTVHGYSLEELKRRPGVQVLLEGRIFERFVLLNRTVASGHTYTIYDANQRNLLTTKMGGYS
ncbi:stage III sporulation protein AA [Virgibacillus pantothenticus]|uniref:Stage III sporulation protein AA n=1 Tax=Virgibacillus pantothenticus TaxID=1473 RepID=A0A0L0QQH8_VIRPA|nr:MULTISPECIES: stage III sporulation protein AA [Virgibacillus]API90514.1 stage III sporulation protein AA [Virgibacillus sp. 6R]KNE20473.1 stage III sporulation protein AA [Virgibacillus pantothenticus]MED3735977.1 stage III sporulation protein AA [Virgibacillus pantothenticus]SIS51601.1 stage III sporulation protein AA [Virgibacillus pantothenticus]GIP61668.1 stage III sporulation protein AA [Virgibacillus pantothenticus]